MEIGLLAHQMTQLSSKLVSNERQASKQIEQEENWARTFTYSAVQWRYPESVEDLQKLVARSTTIKAVGSRHSFSTIADTAGDMISLERLPPVMEINRERQTLTVDAGMCYKDVCKELDHEGFAFPNMASLSHISIVGACSTATHGSGEGNGNLSSSVAAIEFVAASGQLITLSREMHSDQFSGAVVSLGALGVITKITLDIVPAFTVRQYVYENMPWSQVEKHFDELQASAYSVNFFLNWSSNSIDQIWLKIKVDEAEELFDPVSELFGAALSLSPANASADFTNLEGIPGRWYERLPLFTLNFNPSKSKGMQSEYFIPRRFAVEALRAVFSLRELIVPLVYISEVRTIAADNLWMSMAYQQDSVAIHFKWKTDAEPADIQEVLRHIEGKLAAFGARPHWSKVFIMDRPQLQAQYKKLPDFQKLLSLYDPHRKFRNAYLDKYIYP